MTKKLKFEIEVRTTQHLADVCTPVSAYLNLRSHFSQLLLLESADYRGQENRFSYICINPLSSFRVQSGHIISSRIDGSRQELPIRTREDVLAGLRHFWSEHELVSDELSSNLSNGLFGYLSYQAVPFFEDIKFEDIPHADIPVLWYSFFQFVVGFDHFSSRLFILENKPTKACSSACSYSRYDLLRIIEGRPATSYPFILDGTEVSNFTDSEYSEVIQQCVKHIKRGDVFQIVPSRRFAQKFKGDDFAVYRALRAINPSPYLFYFDMGGFRILGSSPEAQLVASDGRASIFPIAGTYRRGSDEASDERLAAQLSQDPKEAAEHVMLVDLARNDLSRHCRNVRVEVFKEVQFYSHVIHLVSKVTGDLFEPERVLDVLADTFPAGTLTGAPKYKAMELLDRYERGGRTFYGGAIGIIGSDYSTNHAIVIRSLLSMENSLYLQAGGGVVADSVVQSEVMESNNKLMALRAALEMAAQMEEL